MPISKQATKLRRKSIKKSFFFFLVGARSRFLIDLRISLVEILKNVYRCTESSANERQLNYIMCPMCAHFILYSISHCVREPNMLCGNKMNTILSRILKSKEKKNGKIRPTCFCVVHMPFTVCMCVCARCMYGKPFNVCLSLTVGEIEQYNS